MAGPNEATLRITIDPDQIQRAVDEAVQKALGKVTEDTSDGYHTFGELYEHRRALTAALGHAWVKLDWWAWRSKAHHPDDRPIFDGYFVVGIATDGGMITYHYELAYWDDFAAFETLEHAPEWDGATPEQTVERLLQWARYRVG